MSRGLAIFLTVVLAGLAAVAAVPVTAWVSEALELPIFRAGDIMHGTICILFPGCFLMFGGISWLILRRFVKTSTPDVIV